jgi:arylsulfatase A-like enzyme
MAGGSVKPDIVYGATDELGYSVVENPVHVHDLHATILHLMGIDHTRLNSWYQGRNFRLTDVFGRVVEGIIG